MAEEIEHRLYSITERLTALFPKKIDLSLARIERFLAQMGNPHHTMPPAIHVAGTNGKGSSIAFLRSGLENLGYSCHAMTSPHLVRFNERVILAGKEISTSDFMDILDECEHVNAGDQISYFEIVIAATFLAFSRHDADYSLVETGLGGRLDATNVVPAPVATLITMISYDHMDYLGNTLPEIAAEKAGIMKKGAPCIIGAQTQEALDAGVMDVFEDHAKNLGVALLRYGHEWHTEKARDGFLFTFHDKEYHFPIPSLIGAHQIRNAGAVLALILTLHPDANITKLKNAITNTQWRARLQKLEALGQHVWLDGGHNDSAGCVLAEQARVWDKEDNKPLHLIVGMVNRKNPDAFLGPLLPHVASITCIPIPHSDVSFSAQELKDAIKNPCNIPIMTGDTFDGVLQNLDPRHRVLITGSLYLSGAVLGHIEKVVPQQNEW